MAADFKLNIPITADGRSAVSNLNETADSASKLFKDLVKGTATVKEFDAAMGEDLAVAARKAGEGFKVIEAQYKTIIPLFEKARQKFSENANATEDQKQAFRDLEATYKVLKEEVDKKRAADDAEAEAIRKRNDELKKQAEEDQRIIDYLHEMAEAQDEYNARLREQAAIYARIDSAYDKYTANKIGQGTTTNVTYDSSNMRFYQQVGDSVGVAREELKLYEAQLRRVLNAENASPAAVGAATNAYKKQKAMVDSLTKSEAVHVSGLTKLLSVAKNILKFQLLMGPITAAIRGFRNTISDSIKAAAEAEQVFSKLSTVFSGLEDSANKAATAIASKLGVATSTAASSLSTVADLLQAQGMGTAQSLTTASQWVSQFSDIIAFKDINMTLEEFAQNFMSGAAGNLRNFRTFGSIVKESAVNARLAAEGLDKLTGSQLELAKMTTRANMALEQQANAMGATKREWNDMLSVNRRYEETTKSLKENLGELINKALKPAKAWWTEILNTMNKAVKAANEYAKGVRNIAVYDVKNNAGDKAMFRSALRDTPATLLNQNFSAQNLNADNFVDSEYMSQLDAIDRLLVMYSVTVKEFAGYLKEWGYESVISASTIKLLTQKEKERNAELEKQAAIEKRRTNIEGIASDYDSFTEVLKAITGVNINTPDWTAQSGQFAYLEGGENLFKANVGSSIMKAITDSLDSLDVGSLDELSKKFGDVIAGALDELDEGDLRSAQIESIRKLFEATWNEFAEGGFTDEEKAKLEEIRDTYKKLNNELDQYNEKLKNQTALIAMFTSIDDAANSSKSAYARLVYQHGLTGNDAENARDMAYYDAKRGRTDYYNQLIALGASEGKALAAARQWYEYQIKIADEEYDYAKKTLELEEKRKKELEKEEALKAAQTTAANYRTNLNNYGLTSYQVTLKDLQNKEANALSGAEANLYSEAIQDFITVTAKELSDAFSGMAYEAELATIGMDENEKALYSLEQSYLANKAILEGINADTTALTGNYENQKRALVDLQTKQKEYNDRITAQASAYSLVGGAKQSFLDRAITKDYMSRGIKVQGTTFSNPNENQARVFLEYNKSIQKLNEDLALLDTYVNDAGETVYDFGGGIGYTAKEIEDILEGELLVSLKDLADSAKEASVTWEDIYKDANPFASEVSTFNMGKEASEGGIGGGIWALLLELLKNTEAFQTLVSLFKDTFVPILDAILKPLMPVLKMFAAFFDNLDWELAFDIMKIIAEILAGTLFVIKAAINTIEAVVKTIYYAITLQWGKIGDVWKNYVDTTKEDLAKMQECIEAIRDTNFEIARNTDDEDKDLALLRDLWNRGIIDEQTYYKESGSLHGNYLPTPVTPYYPTPSKSVTVGNLTINAPNGDINTIIKELYRYGLIDQPVNVPITAGGYGY